ncbi:hypothetical protein [Pararhizobium gei]|uniref:hypothetical protein n=1 Tax=Pararhizobium gei TaxID=1395951 RepID=UPI0023DC5E12|nr:hypothetical protein [Rhizobium gei]
MSSSITIRQPRYRAIFSDDEQRAELAVVLWQETVAALKDAGAVSMANLSKADRYVRARVEYESIYPQAAAEGPVKVGPNGGDVFNFAWSACEKLNDRLLKLEESMFGKSTAQPSKKPEAGSAPSDEFLGPDNGLRQ